MQSLKPVLGVLLFLGCESRQDAKPEQKTAQKEMVQVEAPVEVVETPAEDPALRDALLGMKKKASVVAAVRSQKQKTRRVRPAPVVVDDVVEEPDDSVLTDYDFQSTVGEWAGVKRCIVSNARRGEEPVSGAVRVSFRISDNGRVKESKVVDASSARARSIAPCVEKKAKRIRFKAFTAQAEVTKEAKFVF